MQEHFVFDEFKIERLKTKHTTKMHQNPLDTVVLVYSHKICFPLPHTLSVNGNFVLPLKK